MLQAEQPKQKASAIVSTARVMQGPGKPLLNLLIFSPLDFKDQLPFLLQLGPFTFAPPSLTKHIMVQIKFYWCKSSFSSYSIRWAVETDSRMQRLAPFPEERSRDLTLNSELVPLLVHFWAFFFLRVTLSGQIFSSTPRPDDSYLSQW